MQNFSHWEKENDEKLPLRKLPPWKIETPFFVVIPFFRMFSFSWRRFDFSRAVFLKRKDLYRILHFVFWEGFSRGVFKGGGSLLCFFRIGFTFLMQFLLKTRFPNSGGGSGRRNFFLFCICREGEFLEVFRGHFFSSREKRFSCFNVWLKSPSWKHYFRPTTSQKARTNIGFYGNPKSKLGCYETVGATFRETVLVLRPTCSAMSNL